MTMTNLAKLNLKKIDEMTQDELRDLDCAIAEAMQDPRNGRGVRNKAEWVISQHGKTLKAANILRGWFLTTYLK